jgi:hypothetical protein
MIRAACLTMLCSWVLIPTQSWAPPLQDTPPTPPILLSGEERDALIAKLEELLAANRGLARALHSCRSANRI